MDEARVGQKGRLCHRWWTRGRRPPGRCDGRFAWAYIFAAVEPATGAEVALGLPATNTAAMNLFLATFAAGLPEHVHAALVLDGAGWHVARDLVVPANVTLVPLPPYSPGRVGDWRGGGRTRGVAVGRRLSPAAGASARVVAPFPVAARQTGRAACPHPAFTCVLKLSPSAGRHSGAAGGRGRASRTDTRPGIGGTRCLAGRSVASTIVEPAARHIGAPSRRSGAPALG